VNPYGEPAMERYWVAADVESVVFGTKITDYFFQVQASGDVAFLNGVLKHLINEKWMNDEFVRRHTTGFEDLRHILGQTSWEELETASGASRDGMREFARSVAESRRAVFVWGMGITQDALRRGQRTRDH